jgi:hypothetical protein
MLPKVEEQVVADVPNWLVTKMPVATLFIFSK